MAKLVHLNGPPGIGKSTLARRYVHDHPLSVCLDIDGVRRLIGRWDEYPAESGLLARQMAIQMMITHLGASHDVVVPQYVARPDFVGELAAAAARAGASFYEIVLMDDRAAAIARFEARGDDPTLASHHRDAVRLMRSPDGVEAMYDRIVAVLPELTKAIVLSTTTGDVDGSYQAMMGALNDGR